MIIDATLLRARAYIQAGGSKDALATAAGIHRNTLVGMESDEWTPTIRTVLKIASGLNILDRETPNA